MIETLGPRLKDRRKELNLTIEEVVEKTKLHPGRIREIEEGNLDKISPAYIKGFIRIYASFLGVDIGNVLDEIPSLNVQKKSEAVRKKPQIKLAVPQIKSAVPQKKEDKDNKVQPRFNKVIGFSFLAVIILWGVIVFGKFAVQKIQSAVKNYSAVKNKKPVKEIKKTPAPKVNLPKVSSKPKSADGIASQEITAALTAKRNCFLRVKVDGKLLFEGILRKGIVETWKGKKEIEFKMSDGSAVYLEVNGKPVPSLTAMNKPVKSFKITPLGISVDK